MPSSFGGPWNPACPTTNPPGSSTAALAIQRTASGLAAMSDSRSRHSQRSPSVMKYPGISTPASVLAAVRSLSRRATRTGRVSATNRTATGPGAGAAGSGPLVWAITAPIVPAGPADV